MICPKKGGGSNFLDHRSSKLGKLQAPKARSCYTEGKKPLTTMGSGGASYSSPAGSGAERQKTTRFEHFMPNGVHFGLSLIPYFLTDKSKKYS